jgi:O-antigen/teichoic acid export membrane protein
MMLRRLSASGSTSNTVASFGISALTRIVSFGVVLVIARYLSIETFGAYVLAVSVAEVLRGVTDFGLDQTLVRGVARRSANEVAVASAVLIKVISGCITITAIAVVGRLAMDGTTTAFVELAYAASTLASISRTLTAPVQADLKTLLVFPAISAGVICRLAAVGAAILAGMGLRGLLATSVIAEAIALGITYTTVSRVRPAHLVRGVGQLWPLFREAAPLGALSILALLYFRIDTILLSILAGQSAVGEYGAVYRTSEALLMVATAVASTALPRLSAEFTRGRAAATGVYRRYLTISTAITASAAGVAMLAPGLVMSLLYGDKYSETGPFFAIMLVSAVVMAINVLQTSALIALDGQWLIARVAAFNLAVNVGLNILLIPTFGVLGACISTLLTEVINSIVQFALLSRHIGSAGTRRIVGVVAGTLLLGLTGSQVVHWSIAGGGVALVLIILVGVVSASPRLARSAPLASGAGIL